MPDVPTVVSMNVPVEISFVMRAFVVLRCASARCSVIFISLSSSAHFFLLAHIVARASRKSKQYFYIYAIFILFACYFTFYKIKASSIC